MRDRKAGAEPGHDLQRVSCLVHANGQNGISRVPARRRHIGSVVAVPCQFPAPGAGGDRDHPLAVGREEACHILFLIASGGHDDSPELSGLVHGGLEVARTYPLSHEREADDPCWVLVILDAIDPSAGGPDDGVPQVGRVARAAHAEDAHGEHAAVLGYPVDPEAAVMPGRQDGADTSAVPAVGWAGIRVFPVAWVGGVWVPPVSIDRRAIIRDKVIAVEQVQEQLPCCRGDARINDSHHCIKRAVRGSPHVLDSSAVWFRVEPGPHVQGLRAGVLIGSRVAPVVPGCQRAIRARPVVPGCQRAIRARPVVADRQRVIFAQGLAHPIVPRRMHSPGGLRGHQRVHVHALDPLQALCDPLLLFLKFKPPAQVQDKPPAVLLDDDSIAQTTWLHEIHAGVLECHDQAG